MSERDKYDGQLCMVLIKVSDISNEARPMDVAEPWLDCLLQEFFEQSDREKMEGLPVTPFMDRDKITKPSSQCSFIGFVLLPLFEAIGRLYPELDVIKQIKNNFFFFFLILKQDFYFFNSIQIEFNSQSGQRSFGLLSKTERSFTSQSGAAGESDAAGNFSFIRRPRLRPGKGSDSILH
jgi:hypothetical protein